MRQKLIEMSHPPRIALVDDDLSVRRALPRLLRSAGYETRAFKSAQELLDSGQASAVSCFLLDIHLERTSGFELLERLRASGASAPVIFITAYDDESSRERARGLGAATLLRKPFDGSALLDALTAALAPARAEGNRGPSVPPDDEPSRAT